MSEYRYSAAALKGDLVRAGIGFVLCATPLALVSLETWVVLLLAAPAGLFVLFGVRTWLRRGVRVVAVLPLRSEDVDPRRVPE